ncbi:30S ribosomal protein S2 [SAR202 cluster bacterium AC-409-J13_OGT_754m]|nr:30S ribosomal protein S2 [SAR202 cluster bacterium AC-409-J13_OGT_754m]
MVQETEQVQEERAQISMKALLEAGVHFGHQTRRWNPRMKPYIFTERNGIHIIDLQKSLRCLEASAAAAKEIVLSGGEILFVGTKKQAQEAIEAEAIRCGMPFVNQRWLGGTLTNFATIRSRADYMIELEDAKLSGKWDHMLKKEALVLDVKLERLYKYFRGIRNMKRVPDALFVVDMPKETICIAEARKLGIPIIAIIDTNCDPELVDHHIPGNDDAIRSIRLISSRIATAAIQGTQERMALIQETIPTGTINDPSTQQVAASSTDYTTAEETVASTDDTTVEETVASTDDTTAEETVASTDDTTDAEKKQGSEK